MFPVIRNISDVLPSLEGPGGDSFSVIKKPEGYTVINYHLASSDSFPEGNPMRRELRGIIFDTETGIILRRPFEKFFNYGEKPKEDKESFSGDDIALEKLDGSMIVPFRLNGAIIWGTKMGLTDVAAQAEEYVNKHDTYLRFATICYTYGVTPIFEWVSRKQRIVLDYPEDQLILLAMRIMTTGEYFSYGDVKDFAEAYNIPVVKAVPLGSNRIVNIKDDIFQKENEEGVVIYFKDGQKTKLKTSWYLQLHRAKESITREKDVVSLILDNKLDDLIPLLLEEDKKKVEKYRDDILNKFLDCAGLLQKSRELLRIAGTSRKDFALGNCSGLYKSWVFTLWNHEENSFDFCQNFIYDWVKSKTTSTAVFKKHIKETILKNINYAENSEQ